MWTYLKRTRIYSHFTPVTLIALIAILGIHCSTSKPLNVPALKTNTSEHNSKSYVVLVSIDGYRNDYTDLYSPPALTALRKEGASAEGLLPIYPSKTFTNHYSIATGLYAENHGIVANSFYDPIRKETYKLSDRAKVQDGSWYGGEPLWVAAEKQGMLAGCYFWPGSEAAIQGIRPTYYFSYNDSTPIEERIAEIKRWLELPISERPHLITLYFSEVDTAGHHYGPRSKEVKEAVLKIDQGISLLQKELDATHLPINLIVVSDHGMQQEDPKKVEYLDDYADLKSMKIEGAGPQVLLYGSSPEETQNVFQKLSVNAKHYKIFKREKMPERFHYAKNPRGGDLVVIAEAPYSVGVHDFRFIVTPGNHGYDPDTTPSMRGIFYSTGPQIKPAMKLPLFRNIHIYPFIMKILGLKLPKDGIDGKAEVLDGIYK